MIIPKHLGGHQGHTCRDYPVLKHLKQQLKIKSMVDIGCGPGAVAEDAAELKIDWFGIDGDPSVCQTTDTSLLHDFTIGPPEIDKTFDLAWSVEFLEHVYEEYMDNYMQVFAKANYVCCTAAPPGTGGHHHVNEQDKEYWIDAFKQYGFTYNEDRTMLLYRISKMRKKFFKRSGMFFYK